jgi:hypothetical protein
MYSNSGSRGDRMNQEFMIGLRVFRHIIFPPHIMPTEATKAENTYIIFFVNIILKLSPSCLNFYI